MVTILELKKRVLKHYRVKCIFCRNFIPPFQNWTFLKMSNFQNLTTTFPEILLLKNNKENCYIECYHLSCYFLFFIKWTKILTILETMFIVI